MGSRYAFCFTSYRTNAAHLRTLMGRPEGVQYLVWQLEMCPDTKRVHVQGYVELEDTKKTTRVSKLKKIFQDEQLHVEARKGTQEQAIAYCTKDETRLRPHEAKEIPHEYLGFHIFGEPHKDMKQGKRKDIDSIVAMIRSGCTADEVLDTNAALYIRSYKAFNDLISKQAINRRSNKPMVIVVQGPPGVGKTTWAIRMASESGEAFHLQTSSNNGNEWWTGYSGQPIIILDDSGAGPLKLVSWLQLCDAVPMILETKGGGEQCHASTIIVTTNTPLEEWYPNQPLDRRQAAWRRIDHYIVMGRTIGGVGQVLLAHNGTYNVLCAINQPEFADIQLEQQKVSLTFCILHVTKYYIL